MIKLDDKKVLIIAIAVSILALIGGSYHLLSQWGYYDEGHGIILIVYAVACFALFFAVRFMKIIQIAAVLVLLGLILNYANEKFDWRKTYIDNANKGNPFILEEYISAYPTLEEHSLGWIWGTPRWVEFANECINPALNGGTGARECRSAASITDHYNIDALSLVNEHYRKMQNTAKRLESGQLQTRRQYQACLLNKTCAKIPLLPPDVDSEAIDRQSEEHLGTRRMFWSLVNDERITPELCEYMTLCRALRNLGVMAIDRPPQT